MKVFAPPAQQRCRLHLANMRPSVQLPHMYTVKNKPQRLPVEKDDRQAWLLNSTYFTLPSLAGESVATVVSALRPLLPRDAA